MVNRQKQSYFIEKADKCVRFVIKKYSWSCTIVFDSYHSEPTTKDQTNNFRTKKNGIRPEVEISPCSKLAVRQEEFLSNNMNKQRFINLLSERFKHFGVKTVHVNDDADLLIGQTAIAKARDISLNVICENTDFICLLWHYFDRNGHNIEVCTLNRIWEIRKLLNTGSQDYILLAQAFLGCDTISRIYGLQKERVLKIDKMKEACKYASLVFYDSSSKKEDIEKAGENFLLILLGWSKNITRWSTSQSFHEKDRCKRGSEARKSSSHNTLSMFSLLQGALSSSAMAR